MKKKLLAIAGSPRKGGNTDLLLAEVLRTAQGAGVDTHMLKLSELKIAPCTDCGACRKTGECVQQDDMQAVYTQLLDSYYIVIASPLYFMGVSAQLKALIDRCQALWSRRYVLKKELRAGTCQPRGMYISAAALNKGDEIFAGSIQTVKALFYTLNVEYKGEILCHGLEEKGAVKQHPELLEKVRQATLQLFADDAD
ncbi:MAG TPA: flavodoxin family protein [Candidatus Hypogeohydataceae bacterium YC41]